MSYQFKEAVCKEFALRISTKNITNLDLDSITDDMKDELVLTIVEYIKAKVLAK